MANSPTPLPVTRSDHLPPEWMYPDEAARVLGYTADWVRKLARDGELRFSQRVRGGTMRISAEDVRRMAAMKGAA